ncbi:MAG: hypothetical protein ABSE64_08035 [Vulcanimicrobiaceae bacterium]
MRGLPPSAARTLRAYLEDGFPACEECASEIRLKNQDGLFDRLKPLRNAITTVPRADKFKLFSLIGAGELCQRVFWCGLSEEFGKTIPVRDVLDPAVQVIYDLIDVSIPKSQHPNFGNGIQIYALPRVDLLYIEELRSRVREEGHASIAMAALVSAADLRNVRLAGVVEAHEVDGTGSIRTLDELRSWYGRLGFVPDSSYGPDGVRRDPLAAETPKEREAAFKRAKERLRLDRLSEK